MALSKVYKFLSLINQEIKKFNFLWKTPNKTVYGFYEMWIKHAMLKIMRYCTQVTKLSHSQLTTYTDWQNSIS